MSRLSKRLLRLPSLQQRTGAVTDASQPRVADPEPESGPGQLAPDPRMVGLRDAAEAGLYNQQTGELFHGMPIGPEDLVIDVGCGEAGALGFCADRGADVIAIDHHEGTLNAARSNLQQRGPGRKEFRLGKGEHLPVDDDTATRVICMEVLEHVDDPSTVLAELVRIGQPGALYMITVPDALQEHLQERVAPASYFQPPNHIRIIERDEFDDLVGGAGLEIMERSSYGFFWSIWFALFWSRGVDIENPNDPVLNHWAATWQALLDSENSAELRSQLNAFLPKAQVIIARKPSR